jgi:hypothetical protein
MMDFEQDHGSNSDEQLWQNVLGAYRNVAISRYAFFHQARDKAPLIRKALKERERTTALRYLLDVYDEEVLKELLPDLLKLASVGHSDVVLAREAILSIRDRAWLLETIDPIARKLLEAGDEEEYRRLAELYEDLDTNLLQRHLERCRSHPDPDVREVAEDFTIRP